MLLRFPIEEIHNMSHSNNSYRLALLSTAAALWMPSTQAQVRDFTEQYKKTLPSVVKVHSTLGLATGFAVRLRGNPIGSDQMVVIVTDARVVGNDPIVEISPRGRAAFTGKVIKRYPDPINLAFVEARFSGVPPLRWADSAPEIGSPVFVIGTKDIGGMHATGTLTSGILSNYLDTGLMQTDAAINSGNCGGPLLNLRGEVIGMAGVATNQPGINFGLVGQTIESRVPDWQEILKSDLERNRRLLGPQK
jgi:S1-C subfamily serine protease